MTVGELEEVGRVVDCQFAHEPLFAGLDQSGNVELICCRELEGVGKFRQGDKSTRLEDVKITVVR